MGIILHKKFRLNPTNLQCVICGEEKNETAFLGSTYQGKAPSKMVLDIEPCELCKKTLCLGETILLYETASFSEGKEITGNYLTMSIELFQELFTAKVPDKFIALAGSDVFDILKKEIPNLNLKKKIFIEIINEENKKIYDF